MTSCQTLDELAKTLWREGLIIIYRLLAILKLESNDDPARTFTFASTSLWRNTYSPSMALTGIARNVLGKGAETGSLLESGMKSLFRMLETGLECSELSVKPLGGALFGKDTTPILSNLAWGERAVAWLLDRLLWTPKKRGAETRERVHYGSLNVEDLGRVYEALLELEPGITSEPMCRLRRQKLEVVVPVAQGEKYRPAKQVEVDEIPEDETSESESEDSEEEAEETPVRGKKTKVEWIEEINPNRFYLRVGLGRKASGSYYTPHSFVRFLVQETLGPQVAERSPQDDPKPLELLKLKVLDPAMGSGHFLVEACRFLGDKLYEACRLCDEKALAAERRADKSGGIEKDKMLEESRQWRKRIIDLPDPDDELLKYLPSRSPEGEETGLSQKRAEALCRRLVATHCLYGVDKNPLAVELAKLSLWLESHAEGMPLTFLDHRLIVGDSLTGPFWHHLIFKPGNPKEPISNLFQQNLDMKFTKALSNALDSVKDLDSSIGISVVDIEGKKKIKAELDRALLPFHIAAAAWSGGVMLGSDHCDDDAYAEMLQVIADTGDLPECLIPQVEGGGRKAEGDNTYASRLTLYAAQTASPLTPYPLHRMIARGLGVDEIPVNRDTLYELVESGKCVPALSYDLAFPEVFYPTGVPHGKRGFHGVLGNPPWNKANLEMPEYMGGFDFRFVEASTSSERKQLEAEYVGSDQWKSWLDSKTEETEVTRFIEIVNPDCVSETKGFGGGDADIFAPFIDRSSTWLKNLGVLGMVLPSALHVSKSLKKLRSKILNKAKLRCYFCFENKKSLFEIHKSWKFTPVVLSWINPGQNPFFPAQFYLHSEEWLLAHERNPKPFLYSVEVIRRMDPENLIFQEFKSTEDVECAESIFKHAVSCAEFINDTNWYLRRELDATDDRWRIEYQVTPDRVWKSSSSFLIHHQPGTLHHYTDLWKGADVTAVPFKNLLDKRRILYLTQFYRAAYRRTARATDERTSIYTILPPGTTATNSLFIEGNPENRPNYLSLSAIAICNSFVFDWALRLHVGSKTVSKFIMESTPFSQNGVNIPILAHSALRLICNHDGFLFLWDEQLKDLWRENKEKGFPVLVTEDERLKVRSIIDSVVANSYGLSIKQYEHVLRSFSHKTFPTAPELCLAKFDELKQIGLEAFTKKYDPYWDIPLNENLPQPDPVVLAAIEKYFGSAEVREAEGVSRKGRSRSQQRKLFE